jgi:endo-1,4-beta-xylanase
MHQRTIFILALLTVLTTSHSVAQKNRPSLKETFRNDFLIGTALNPWQIQQKDTAVNRLVLQHFNAITPENSMKATHLHPEWSKYNFAIADQLVAYAQQHNIKINGHTLICHSQLPNYVKNITNADSLRQYMKEHITTIAGRYKGKVFSWDVVNEALEGDGSLRKSIFQKLLGDDYIVEAFKLAQQAAPDAELYYNDYNIEGLTKRRAAITLIKKIQAAGVRIDGVGIQGHWSAEHVPLADIEKSIQEFSDLGIKVMFTELDLNVLPTPYRRDVVDVSQRLLTNTKETNPWPNGLPDYKQVELAKSYADLFRLFLKYKDKISRITFWGVHDGQSWLNNFPMAGRVNYPLLFDRNYQPKPAFDSVIKIKDQSEL